MTCLEDADFALALRLQEEENQRAGVSVIAVKQPVDVAEFAGSQKRPNVSRSDASPARPLPPPGTSLVDEAYELIDPTPDIYQLFRDFDRHFFWGKLGGVELKWSPRMTRCAGVCSYQPASGLCSVRLSRPLLTLRPRSDLVETLLHEMIHALLFVTRNIDNHEEHGPEFHRHMHRINKIAGTNITVYHTFHEEVKHMLTHWWRCTGPCRSRPPYFGFAKRSMNRAPGKSDFWWPNHQTTCGGTFEKIKEPDGYGKKKGKKDIGSDNTLRDIRNFVVKGKALPVTEKPSKRPNGSTTPAGGASAVGGRGRRRGRGSRGGRTGTGDARPPTGRPGKRPTTSTSGDGASAQKRPSVNPTTGVRPNIGTVNNDGNQRVNNIANNVHGFQKGGGRGRGGGGGEGATAMAGGGSRTVTVPVRGRGRGAGGGTEERTTGGGEGTGGGGERTEPTFNGRGHVLGGGSGVPWYKRDLPPPGLLRSTVPAASTSSGASGAASTRRTSTGIFSSPEQKKPTPAAKPADDWEIIEDESSLVSCPVCGEKVNLKSINEHVDLCLVTECERSEKSAGTGVGTGAKSCGSPGPSSPSVWQDDEDELMMSQAADELETSLEVTGWEQSTEDDQLLADAADELETSLAADSARGDRPNIYTANADDASATARSPASDSSTVYNDILDGGAGAAAVRSRSPSDASTVYDEIINEPIVISSSDDDEEEDEDIATQRANLSDVIKDFIKVEESDDDMFED